MKKTIFCIVIAITSFLCSCGHKSTTGNTITFYEVPLVCGAAPDIGCGSRIKPFFIEAEREAKIKELWSNRQGTVIAIVWADDFKEESSREDLIQPLFNKHSIEAKLINEEKKIASLNNSFKTDPWYKGEDIDQLSLEEAATIASDMVGFAQQKGYVDKTISDSIRKDIEEYFRVELVKVRTATELNGTETREKWKNDAIAITSKYIGQTKSEELAEAYLAYRAEIEQESCCSKEEDHISEKTSSTSEITCPECGHKKTERMPTEICQLAYTCSSCKYEMNPKNGDCCVFCSYGDHKCPSMQ